MRLFQLLSFIILCTALAFTSCKDGEKDKVRDAAVSNVPISNTPTPPTSPSTTASTNPNEPHYKCPKNCQGGVGAAAGVCPVCGTELAHNQAYHNTSTSTPTPSLTPPTPTTPGDPAAATPAQNAKGVYHYTCSKGCAGGAAGAGNCATCGGALAHNQAYHQ